MHCALSENEISVFNRFDFSNLYDKEGYCVAQNQLEIPVQIIKTEKEKNSASAEENGNFIVFSGEEFKYIFSKDLGTVVSLIKNGKEQLTAPIELTVMRAPTDFEFTIK